MIQLTAHFALEEFQKHEKIPPSCILIFTELAAKILEPVRAEFDKPIQITSGYRSVAENASPEVHGQPNSEHVATTWMCACDFEVIGIGQRLVFDWMRNHPSLPFHQLILEHSKDGTGSIIHVSINRMMPGVRSVLEGAEHNASGYAKVDHVAYVLPQESTSSMAT